MTVTITNNIIDILGPNKAVSFNGSELVNVHWAKEIERSPIHGLTPAPLATGGSSGYVAPTPRYIIILPFSNNKRTVEHFYLKDVTNQPTWTDNEAGAINAVNDLKAAMLLAGGGGGGINSISGGSTGFSFTAGPNSVMSGTGNVLQGNTLFVDAVNGDDGTGSRGFFNLPYATIQAAIAGASNGDCIVVRPGSYAGINDLVTDAPVLSFVMMPGVSAVDVTIDTIDANWYFYGSPLGDVVVNAAGAFCFFYCDISGIFTCDNFNSAKLYAKVGSMKLDASSVYLYNGSVEGDLSLENGGSLNAYNSVLNTVTTSTGGSVQGTAACVTGAVTGDVQFNGDVFAGSLTPPVEGAAPFANANGSWSWDAAPPKVWNALIYWNGGTPDAVVLGRNTIGPIVVSGTVSYLLSLTLAGAFPSGKTIVTCGDVQFDTNGDTEAASSARISADQIDISSVNSFDIQGCPVKIEVYP